MFKTKPIVLKYDIYHCLFVGLLIFEACSVTYLYKTGVRFADKYPTTASVHPNDVHFLKQTVLASKSENTADAERVLAAVLDENESRQSEIKRLREEYDRRHWLDTAHFVLAVSIGLTSFHFLTSEDFKNTIEISRLELKRRLAAVTAREAAVNDVVRERVAKEVDELATKLHRDFGALLDELKPRETKLAADEKRVADSASKLRTDRVEFDSEKARITEELTRAGVELDKRRHQLERDLEVLKLGEDVCGELNALLVRFDAHLALDPASGPVKKAVASFPATRTALRYWKRYLQRQAA